MDKIDNKTIEKLVKKNLKSKFKNCFQCKYFPYHTKITLTLYSIEKLGWYYGLENIEKLHFRCVYLRKKTTVATRVFRDNYCLCFDKIKL
jgi:hypothetical protein